MSHLRGMRLAENYPVRITVRLKVLTVKHSSLIIIHLSMPICQVLHYNAVIIVYRSMKQKVIKIGSSIGVVLSKPIVQELGFKAGQEVTLHLEKGGVLIEHTFKKTDNAQFSAWLQDAVERYRPALEALKNA